MKKLKDYVNNILKEMEVDLYVSDDEIQIRDNDLYIFDPENLTGIALGSMGDGWVCLVEEFKA